MGERNETLVIVFVVLDFDFRGWGVTCEIVLEDQDGTTGNRIYNLYVYIKNWNFWNSYNFSRQHNI